MSSDSNSSPPQREPEMHRDPADFQRHVAEPKLAWSAVVVLGTLGLLAAPAVVVYLLLASLGVLLGDNADTLLTTTWLPSQGQFGLLPLVSGTLATSVLALLVVVPIGLGSAIYLHFYASPRVQEWGDAVFGILGGTPSVVFGLFGTFWFLRGMGLEPSLLVATLVLSMMVLPVFSLLALAALRQVPKSLLAQGAGLGLSREQVILKLALKVTWPRLAAAATFSLARCLGEALAVEMVCGNVANMPTALTTSVRTLTTTLVQEFEYAAGSHQEALFAVALTVVVLAALCSTAAIRLTLGRGQAA